MGDSAKRHGHDLEVRLAAVPERLPAMTNLDDLGVLLPSSWQSARRDLCGGLGETRVPTATDSIIREGLKFALNRIVQISPLPPLQRPRFDFLPVRLECIEKHLFRGFDLTVSE